ncbi:MAG: single-stranded DNA-binding protein [Leptospiraceae bacterium]|nr:MAG: single-stranded DNA-binding protein [Leptospiraceae bacterium]
MSDLNYVILIGRLTADPVYKVAQTGNGFCTFSIANNRRYKKQNGELAEETNFINCITWGKLSEFTRNYLKKGMLIAIEGRLRQNSWQNEEGKTQSSINVVVNNIQILTPKQTSQESEQTINNIEETPELENPILDDTEDDIPF